MLRASAQAVDFKVARYFGEGQPQSLSCFNGPFNWQVWQAGFLSVPSVHFDCERPDKITRGACAYNDDKVISKTL